MNVPISLEDSIANNFSLDKLTIICYDIAGSLKKRRAKLEIRCDLKDAATPEELDALLFTRREKYQKAREEYPEFTVEKLGSIGVSFDLPFSLDISLLTATGEKWDRYFTGREIVELKTTNGWGRVPRSEVTVSTSDIEGGGPLYLCIELFPHLPNKGYDHPLTDRGLCWVTPGSKACVSLTIKNWEKNPWEKGEIAKIIQKAEERAREVIGMQLGYFFKM